jgi:hypothetical protein
MIPTLIFLVAAYVAFRSIEVFCKRPDGQYSKLGFPILLIAAAAVLLLSGGIALNTILGSLGTTNLTGITSTTDTTDTTSEMNAVRKRNLDRAKQQCEQELSRLGRYSAEDLDNCIKSK